MWGSDGISAIILAPVAITAHNAHIVLAPHNNGTPDGYRELGTRWFDRRHFMPSPSAFWTQHLKLPAAGAVRAAVVLCGQRADVAETIGTLVARDSLHSPVGRAVKGSVWIDSEVRVDMHA